MTAIAFDTLAYSRTLQAAGMSQEQADALAEAQAKAMSEMVSAKELATKGDLLALEHRLLKWVMGIALAQTAVIVAVIGVAIALVVK